MPKCSPNKPCDDCPFLKKGGIRLNEDRIDEIIEADLFHCHKTVHYDESHWDEEGDYYGRGDELMCAGWMIMRENLEDDENMRIPQIMQISERLGLYDKNKLMEHRELVFETPDDMRESAI